ncbi:hypothetical protein [Ktedonospora formicarum]|uniref:Uncharacterized protein n=1 Tax=Ktedonospora formicarum TaxID=2778364 RepID=A0A8J3I061_9CHLR|nr:hypothetical protein [Ktedonospora formicarum]GHO46904.1 hypothetical protein KSX_50670 [Ktedonospora formicarum]
MRFHWLWPVIILLSAAATSIVTYVRPEAPAKALIVMSFLFLCPGMALTRFLRLHEIVAELIIALTLSFSIDAIVAGLFLYAGSWSISGIIMTLLIFSVTGAIAQFVILHPAIAQRLYALPVRNNSEKRTDSVALAVLSNDAPAPILLETELETENKADNEADQLPNGASTLEVVQEEVIEDQETSHLPKDTPIAEISQTENSELEA